MSEPPRSRDARRLAETAVVRIVDAYGAVPEFVLLGGLVPDLLCSRSSTLHVGTTDVDVQVNLEIAGGSVNAAHLEAALHTAGFAPDHQRVWRWQDHSVPGLVVKAEFLADLDDVPNEVTVNFDGCEQLGAVNLRGTGFATRDWQLRPLTAPGPNGAVNVELRVAGLAGYLLAKTHAANRRRATVGTGRRRLRPHPQRRRRTSQRSDSCDQPLRRRHHRRDPHRPRRPCQQLRLRCCPRTVRLRRDHASSSPRTGLGPARQRRRHRDRDVHSRAGWKAEGPTSIRRVITADGPAGEWRDEQQRERVRARGTRSAAGGSSRRKTPACVVCSGSSIARVAGMRQRGRQHCLRCRPSECRSTRRRPMPRSSLCCGRCSGRVCGMCTPPVGRTRRSAKRVGRPRCAVDGRTSGLGQGLLAVD